MNSNRNRDSAGQYKPQMHDGSHRRPRRRRTPEQIAEAKRRMEEFREWSERMNERLGAAMAASRAAMVGKKEGVR